jgi:hypothetical protein
MFEVSFIIVINLSFSNDLANGLKTYRADSERSDSLYSSEENLSPFPSELPSDDFYDFLDNSSIKLTLLI